MSGSATSTSAATAAATSRSDGCVRELLDRARATPSAGDFVRAALPCLAARFASPCVQIELHGSASSQRERFIADGADPTFWSEPVERALLDALADGRANVQLYRNEDGVIGLARLAVPLLDRSGRSIGALALMARCASAPEAQALSGELQALAALIAGATTATTATTAVAAAGTPGDATLTARKAAPFGSARELCYTIANQLRNKSGCERVSVARVNGAHVELICLSGQAEVQHDSPRIHALVAALGECLDHGPRLVCQHPDSAVEGAMQSGPYRLHRAWHEQSGGSCVASLRLADDGAARLLIGLERGSTQPFRSDELDELAKLVQPYVAALDLLDRAHAGVLSHVRRATVDWSRDLVRPRHWRRKAIVAAAAAFIGWLALGRMAYEIPVPASLRAASTRRIAAPFDGVLAAVAIVPGTRVRSGDVLAQLDTREIELESQRLAHELAVARLEERRAFAERRFNEAAIARARGDELTAQAELGAEQLSRATLRAPFDGWLLRGDLREQVGARLARGQELFEVAPGLELEFELELPEAQFDAALAGAPARFSPFARPEQDERVEVAKVAPVAEMRNGRNVFVLTAASTGVPSGLRPGMEGIAVVEAGRRPVWWVFSHRAVDWLRLHVWP